MSRYFVNDPPVPIPEFDAGEVISDAPPNVIYIRSRMDVETRGKVKNELFAIGKDNAIEMRAGANETALLLHNIVRWEGPGFIDEQGRPIPCDAAHIRTLDPNEPHIEKVLEAINARNLRKVAPNPKANTEPTSATNGLHDASPQNAGGLSLQLATGTQRSASRSVLAGHLHKSDGSTPTTLKNYSDD